MKRGIYLMVNDNVLDNAIALINSIRFYDLSVPIIFIPYNEKYKKAAKALTTLKGVSCYEDVLLLERITNEVNSVFGREFFARPEQFRKQACWFGPFDEFLYLDTDIVVFEKIVGNLNYLSKNDFVCCDYQYLNGNKFLFTPKIMEEKIFSEEDLQYVFNGGFWGSKKGIITEEKLYNIFKECASHPEFFDFSQKVSDMPIINYLVIKLIKKKFNIVRDTEEKGAGSWAGMPHFIREGNKLIDPHVNKPLRYLHWAGIKIKPGCPYYDIWQWYRHGARGKGHGAR